MVDSSFEHAPLNRYEIVGRLGRIVVEHAFRPDDEPGRIDLFRGTDHSVEQVPPANQFAHEADHFARSIRAHRLLEPAEDGVAQARTIEALYASAEAR
jgi:predicted dehydrogenase